MPFNTQDKIDRDLRENDSAASEFQRKVIEWVKPRLKAASDKMCDHHATWDQYDWIYRGYRVADRDDKEALAKGDPPKIIIPLTFAQVQTALGFVMSIYLQREHMFELRGMGPEDEAGKFALEEDLAYQLTRNQFPLKLYFWGLDTLKYGFGITKVDWEETRCKMRVQKKELITPNVFLRLAGMVGLKEKKLEYRTSESVEDVLEYQGNRINTVSPFSFYPDPDLPIAKFDEGAFVCHEEEVSIVSVEREEGTQYHGTDKIDKFSKDLLESRRRRAGLGIQDGNASITTGGNKEPTAMVRSEVQFVATGKEIKKNFDCDLDTKGTYAQKWVVVIGNDNKVIKFKPLGYLHNRYSYNITEYSPDANAFYNPGLAETIQELQNIVTFFLNSHIVNVKKIIANRLVGNPNFIDMDDVNANKTFIRTKGNPPGDISRYLQQLTVNDVTKNHVNDIQSLMSLVQVVTGVNENALGQYSSGRRSATEARNVNAGAAARLKMLATLNWTQGIEPLGRMLLANTRQGRTKEVYEQIVGKRALTAPFEQVVLADPSKIAGGYDFIPYDATLPSDRQNQAMVLQELFTALVSNPDTMVMLQKDPMKLLTHIAELHNIKNIDEFSLDPQQPLVSPQAQVVPDEQAAAAVDAGAQPVDVGGNDLLRELAG